MTWYLSWYQFLSLQIPPHNPTFFDTFGSTSVTKQHLCLEVEATEGCGGVATGAGSSVEGVILPIHPQQSLLL